MAAGFPKRLVIVTSQVDQLRALLAAIIPANPFYTAKFDVAGASRKISNLGQFTEAFPLTTKQELAEDQQQHPPYGTNLTYPLERYVRLHQTSGTSGTPLRWLDTIESWNWMVGNWTQVFRAAEVTSQDRVFCAFSFGPFIGFWLAFEAAVRLGCLALPGGGLSSAARLRLILDNDVSVLCCTPTYAIHLAEVAAREKIDLAASRVRVIIVAGEPGGSIEGTRNRIAQLWPGARVFDHHGMTEVGPVSHECPARTGVLHIMESAFVAEIIDPVTGQAIERGHSGELVLSTLGRIGSPLLRYRTGDMVKAATDTVCECGRSDLALEGGILGRTDDMVIIRGVNIYPSGVEQMIRTIPEVAEYQVHVSNSTTLAGLAVQIETAPGCAAPEAVARELERKFETLWSLRVPVTTVSPGTLPRQELKAKRWLKV